LHIAASYSTLLVFGLRKAGKQESRNWQEGTKEGRKGGKQEGSYWIMVEIKEKRNIWR
jgi:hypothetical protein